MILKNISIEETDKIISEIKDYLKPNFTIALIGELGTGKTYLTSKTANFIGVNNTICSPTFTILNQYKISNNFF
ncbi:MAG TPA: tRNA (adenosine(37)-N6)-threonylcarbamoyltransferase complex ATPase subunit type 1 TsaE, partial [bacterium]|nr:tRNA (adenosine(37)-N6)-threonylcarbamoyltransferase complex ATPase subunit type 1 TsaE [bacterium]